MTYSTMMLVFENGFKSHKCSIFFSGRTLFLNLMVSQSSLKWKILFHDDCAENIIFSPLTRSQCSVWNRVSGGNTSYQITRIWLVQQYGTYRPWLLGNVKKELSFEKMIFSNNGNLHGEMKDFVRCQDLCISQRKNCPWGSFLDVTEPHQISGSGKDEASRCLYGSC